MEMLEIGIIESCFLELFGIPRQPSLVPSSYGKIILKKEFSSPEIIKGLETFSHIWVIWKFHQNKNTDWKHSVRPPRLGGDRKLGVFSTRSPYRPNPLGLSLVKLEKVYFQHGRVFIEIKEHDLLHKTPILDIKPYLKESDSKINSTSGWTEEIINSPLFIKFKKNVEQFLNEQKNPNLKNLIKEYLSLDPRPGYKQKNENHHYANKLADHDIHWNFNNGEILVTDIIPLSN